MIAMIFLKCNDSAKPMPSYGARALRLWKQSAPSKKTISLPIHSPTVFSATPRLSRQHPKRKRHIPSRIPPKSQILKRFIVGFQYFTFLRDPILETSEKFCANVRKKA